MNFQEAVDFLFERLPMFSHSGKVAYKKDLSNTIALCKALGDPQKKIKTIHIAGTNGKGSSSHSLAAVLQKAGYKTGLYTSPHLHDFRERIRINGTMCEEEFVVRFVKKTESLIPIIQPSFFELTTVMAFDYFAQQKVDIAVIETGLGGRLDSTNVILPEVCLITNIGMDHMSILGDTYEKIAFEKAGIIKKNTPVVISEFIPETKPVFRRKAKEMNAPVYFAQEQYELEEYQLTLPRIFIKIKERETGHDHQYHLDLSGIYQTKNILGVLLTIKKLQEKGWKISPKNIEEGVANVSALTGLHGRWEQISAEPRIIVDVAHNEDGLRLINQQLQHMNYNRLHLITGFVKDKDVTAALRQMPKDALYYFTKALMPRAMEEKHLAALAKKEGLAGRSYPNISEALSAVKKNYQSGDLILVCGSTFLVAEVRI